jgi:hypothetical protein
LQLINFGPDHIKNEYIRKELNIKPAQNLIDEYPQNWINRLDRMADDRNAETYSAVHTIGTTR